MQKDTASREINDHADEWGKGQSNKYGPRVRSKLNPCASIF